MILDRDSFCDDVVMDSINMVFGDYETNILNQIYKLQIYSNFQSKYLIFKKVIEENAYLKYNSSP